MKITRAGLEMIKGFEGLRLEAYLCPGGVWTIGYGHTKGVKEGDVIDAAEAERLLREDLSEAEAAVQRNVRHVLTDGQYSALVSFVFNVGVGAFVRSTLLAKLRGGQMDEVPDQLLRWTVAKGKKLRGLLRRRLAEAVMFMGD